MLKFIQLSWLVLAIIFLGSISTKKVLAQTTFNDVALPAGFNHFHQSDGMGGGVAVFDFNRDSLQDIFYTGGYQQAALYRNNGDGTFTDQTVAAGLGATDSLLFIAATSGDIDNDGYRELFLMTEWGHPNYLYYNNGDGTFTDISASAGVNLDSAWSLGAAFGDYDKDGFLDLYVTGYVDTAEVLFDTAGNFVAFAHTCHPNTLYHNNGNNTFTDVTQTMQVGDNGCTLATTFTDYDGDNDVDVYNANDFGQWIITNRMLQNNYPSAFNNQSAPTSLDIGLFGMGIATGDYDQDMDLDYYITNIGRNVLHRNMGGVFIDTSDAAGVGNQWVIQDSLQATGWGTAFIDIDNDSYLDLYVSNGWIDGIDFLMTTKKDPDKLFRNNGDGTFSDISNTIINLDSMSVNRGFAYCDYDNDGDIDLLPVPSLADASLDTIRVPLYQNNLNNNKNWLNVSLEGTISNRDAFGAHIKIYVDNKSWLHEVMGSGSHCSQHSTVAHFGLDTATVVDSLVIHWPNGLVEKYANVAPNQMLYLVEGATVTSIAKQTTNTEEFLTVFPNPARDQVVVKVEDLKIAGQLTIRNALGQIIQQKQLGPNPTQQWRLNTVKWTSGLYFIQLKTENSLQTQKLIVR